MRSKADETFGDNGFCQRTAVLVLFLFTKRQSPKGGEELAQWPRP